MHSSLKKCWRAPYCTGDAEPKPRALCVDGVTARLLDCRASLLSPVGRLVG
jgi:hypothetical protein